MKTGNISLTENSAYKTLLDDYIIKCLGYYTYFRSIHTFSYQFTDKGLQSRRGDFSNTSPDAIISKVREEARNDAEFWGDIMIKYLCDNHELYPEYTTYDEGVRPPKKAYFSGIEFGITSDDCCKDPLK